jgi:hemerythrin superfamily protein
MTMLGERLTHEHKALDTLYEEIANRVHCGDTAALDESWSALEERLLAHFAYEEAHLLPRFESVAPAEALRLREEHKEVRRALAETGIAIELHTVREEHIAEFLTLLRAHAAREEKLLYPWSNTADATPYGSEPLSR